MRDQFSLIIQGPVYDIDNPPNYRSVFSNVIVSSWLGNKETPFDCNFFIRSNYANCLYGYNEHYVKYQVYTTLVALKFVTTPYVVKIRSDEVYDNLDNIYRIVIKEKNCIGTGNIFFRKWEDYPFHPSDHIIAGKTKYVKRMFSRCYKLLRMPNERSIVKKFLGKMPTPEQLLAISYLYHNRYNMLDDDPYLFFDNFYCINMKDLGCRYIMGHGKRYSVEDFGPDKDDWFLRTIE